MRPNPPRVARGHNFFVCEHAAVCPWLHDSFWFTIPPETHSNDFGFFGIFLNGFESYFRQFEFMVCSKFNHTQRDRTCACAVACLHPHNFTSSVVVSLTIHDNIFIYIRDAAKNMKPLWKVEGFFNRTSWESVLTCESFVILGFWW